MEITTDVDYTLRNKKGFTLTEKQNEIVEALLNNERFFNCAQTGLGKTLTTITAAVHKAVRNDYEDLNFVLILPNSAVKAFTDVFTNHLGIPYSIYTATLTRVNEKARFHIFNYSSLSANLFKMSKKGKRKINKEFEALQKIYKKSKNLFLITDEAHSLQDPKTNQYKLVKGIMPLFKGGWFLTATPLLNHLDGFFYMVDLLIPGYFGNIYKFRNTYNIMETKSFWTKVRGRPKFVTKKSPVGFKNLERLQEEFSNISIIRSIDYDVNFIYRSAKLSNYMKRFYNSAAKGLFSGTIDKKTGKATTKYQESAGPRLHDLQRVVSNSHPDFQALDRNKLTEKETLLIKTIEEVLDRDEAMLIYFTYLPTLERVKYILNKLKDTYKIDNIFEVSGNIKLTVRKKVEDAITPKTIVLITSAGTESINLQKANNLIFYETPFPLREVIQAAGRITRMDTLYNSFNVYILEAEGTIDTYKKLRVLSNAEAIKAIIGSSNILPTGTLTLSAEDRQAMKDAYLWWTAKS